MFAQLSSRLGPGGVLAAAYAVIHVVCFGLLDIERTWTSACRLLPLSPDTVEMCLQRALQAARGTEEKMAAAAPLVEFYIEQDNDKALSGLAWLFADRLQNMLGKSAYQEWSFPAHMLGLYTRHQAAVLAAWFRTDFAPARDLFLSLGKRADNSILLDEPGFLAQVAGAYRYKTEENFSADLLLVLRGIFGQEDFPANYFPLLFDYAEPGRPDNNTLVKLFTAWSQAIDLATPVAKSFFQRGVHLLGILRTSGNPGELMAVADLLLSFAVKHPELILLEGAPRRIFLDMAMAINALGSSYAGEFAKLLQQSLPPRISASFLLAMGDAANQEGHFLPALAAYQEAMAILHEAKLAATAEVYQAIIAMQEELHQPAEAESTRAACRKIYPEASCDDRAPKTSPAEESP